MRSHESPTSTPTGFLARKCQKLFSREPNLPPREEGRRGVPSSKIPETSQQDLCRGVCILFVNKHVYILILSSLIAPVTAGRKPAWD
uniref:Uncharacterized protein n=1 Tax=Prolemur simus TaxID=1328070 RepID=A0A8C8YVL8_PROSS